jgi:hypothetical protein
MALPMAAKQLFFCQPRLRTAWARVPRDDAHVSLICDLKSARAEDGVEVLAVVDAERDGSTEEGTAQNSPGRNDVARMRTSHLRFMSDFGMPLRSGSLPVQDGHGQGSGSWLGGESEPVTKRVLLLLDDHAALLLRIWQAPRGHRARSTSCYMPVLYCSGYDCSISISDCSGVFLRLPDFFTAPSSRPVPVLAKPPDAGCMRAMAAQRSDKMLRGASRGKAGLTARVATKPSAKTASSIRRSLATAPAMNDKTWFRLSRRDTQEW